MKVSAFSSSEKIIGLSHNTVFVHPILFVAKGTHSLYLTHDGNPNGIQVTYPDDLRSDYCGKFDTPQPPLNIPPSPGGIDNVFVLLAKFFSGALFPLGALGWAAAVAWIIAEGGPDFGVRVRGTYEEKAAPDETAAAGAGRTIKPANLVVPRGGADVKDWLSHQGEQVDNRTYDFIVDRDKQVWWPNNSGEGGFRGRWGPRVENDPLGRRAGMRVPKFWEMFFRALVIGKNTDTL